MEKPIKYFLEFAEQEGVSIDDVILLLQEHRNLKKQQDNERNSFPVSEATALIYNVDISTLWFLLPLPGTCYHFGTPCIVSTYQHFHQYDTEMAATIKVYALKMPNKRNEPFSSCNPSVPSGIFPFASYAFSHSLTYKKP